MIRVYKYKIRQPKPDQVAIMEETLETLRRLYNRALAERKEYGAVVRLMLATMAGTEAAERELLAKLESEEFTTRVISLTESLMSMSVDEHAAWREKRKEETSLGGQKRRLITEAKKPDDELAAYLQRVNVGNLQQVLIRLDRAFQAFYRRCKAGGKPGYPRFRRRGGYRSCQYNSAENGCKWLSNGRVRLQHIGTLKVHYYRPIPDDGEVRNIAWSRQADGWWLLVTVKLPDVEVEPSRNPPIGVAIIPPLGYVSCDGRSTTLREPPLHYAAAMEKLAAAQRRVSRREKGSSRRKEAVRLLGKHHLHVANQRHETQIVLANELVRPNGTVYIEKIVPSDILTTPAREWDEERRCWKRTGKRGKAEENRRIADIGWSQFVDILNRQAEQVGAQVVEIVLSDEETELAPEERAKALLYRGENVVK